MSGNKSYQHEEGIRSDPVWAGSSSAGPIVTYTSRPTPEESTPLIPGKKPKVSRNGCKSVTYGLPVLLTLAFIIVNLGFHFFNCPLYPWTMNDIRRGWDKEVAQHNVLREEWLLEQQEHVAIEEGWKRQVEWHEWDVARRIREEEERQERVRQRWAEELEKHAREADEYEQEVARRVLQEQARQERIRREWDEEVQEHEKQVARRIREEEERQKRARDEWDREVEKHRDDFEELVRRENQQRENEREKWRREAEDHDKIEKEHQKREEEERQKLNMFWDNVAAQSCTSYATREYTAQLMNLPRTWERRVEACKGTPLEVHGISYTPKSCEDKGPGVVIGRWEVNQHEPDCTTFWDLYDDKGCTSPGSGKKHITHKLENLPDSGKWREFCATTPIRFNHLQFLGAQECFQSVWGVFGQWELDDSNC